MFAFIFAVVVGILVLAICPPMSPIALGLVLVLMHVHSLEKRAERQERNKEL